ALAKEVSAGELDDEVLYAWPAGVKSDVRAARREGRLRVVPDDESVFLVMNLTRPPFDDGHVRRALAWVLDRRALAAQLPGAGRIAGHLIPDDLLGGRLTSYDPYG